MPTSDPAGRHFHEVPELFEAALRLTEARTGFSRRLVEKDYYCSLVLANLAAVEGLVFKGGTCLAKVHAAFYRLSEDLDFVIPTPTDASRAERRARTGTLKARVAKLPEVLPAIRVAVPMHGANESTQYLATLAYESVVTGEPGMIELEVGLREPLIEPAVVAAATTILIDPGQDIPVLAPVPVVCMTLRESLAEKVRAALTRREVAIRDFFDLDLASQRLGVDLQDPEFLVMVGSKLRVPGNGPIDVSGDRRAALRSQIRTRLQPVLRPPEFAGFDLDRAFRIVASIAGRLVPIR